MLFLKYLIFITSGTLVFLFTCYINLAYLLDVFGQLFSFNAFKLNYDYIVVGAGTSGAIIAARLAENGQSVLLVEAGGTAPPFLDIPLLSPLLQNSIYDWQYITVPQHNACKALKNNQSKWPMGKILGGTSRLNYMTYVRGHPQDYANWFPDFNDYIIGKNDSVKIQKSRWHTDLVNAILKGIVEIDGKVSNINEALDTGFMKVQLFADNGRRWSTDDMLYRKYQHTLDIITHARVDKVLLNSKKATGIQFTKFGKTSKITANDGVIVSAGVIGSPKLLMLSGIGPEKYLKDVNIKVINDLPVGQNLMDHVLTGIDLVRLKTSLSISMTNVLNPMALLNYFFFGKGPWTSSGIEVLGTFHSTLQENKFSKPDLQLMILPLGISTDYGIVLKEAMGISDEVYGKYFSPLENDNVVTIAPVLLHPKSLGEMKLRSKDPSDEPLIDPKYLSNKYDIDALIDGIQYLKKLINTNAMKKLGASLYKKSFPGCEANEFDSLEYWECYVRHLSLTAYHPAGTCRMGDVVDTSFRVYNIKNLYVVDASVLPSLPSGNINAALIMMAKKAVDILKQIKNKQLHSFRNYNNTSLLCYTFNICNRFCYP
ncbi:glucose dehydrogenase [FAD, quinone]-like isoform X1 [Vespa mandarinia]|uniref:glucose dehydrogenase [FAD, quinone]-like isoform X1 n=1 Tax=Vespa mandarinia TaxID=7446 RepID=UPI00161F4DDF|nr:glucose dehydrogenase [FAD, quinone]-like isoform X1 [Vespa mandarinia]XP_035730633.1 glucose dehydrogenase [FAD, quinone]-like isoform X1 [Vespa mandarinia]